MGQHLSLLSMAATYSYGKKEKLKSRKRIDQLFTGGRSFSVFPLKVFYHFSDENVAGALQAGVGVSVRNFRKAVDRNRIKRLLREAYRLNKPPLFATISEKKKNAAVFFLYLGKELPELPLLNDKMRAALERLGEECK